MERLLVDGKTTGKGHSWGTPRLVPCKLGCGELVETIRANQERRCFKCRMKYLREKALLAKQKARTEKQTGSK